MSGLKSSAIFSNLFNKMDAMTVTSGETIFFFSLLP